MELMVFCNKIEKLTGDIFSQLIALNQMDIMNISGPIFALKNQTRQLEVALTTRAIKTEIISYKLIDCDESMSRKRTKDEEQTSKNTIRASQAGVESKTPA